MVSKWKRTNNRQLQKTDKFYSLKLGKDGYITDYSNYVGIHVRNLDTNKIGDCFSV